MSLAPSKYMGYTLLHLLCKSSMVPGLVGYPDVGGKSVRWYQRHGMRIMWEKHAINTQCGRINHCHLHLSFCLACRPLLLCSVARVGLQHKLEVHVCPFDLGDQSRCPRFRKKNHTRLKEIFRVQTFKYKNFGVTVKSLAIYPKLETLTFIYSRFWK